MYANRSRCCMKNTYIADVSHLCPLLKKIEESRMSESIGRLWLRNSGGPTGKRRLRRPQVFRAKQTHNKPNSSRHMRFSTCHVRFYHARRGFVPICRGNRQTLRPMTEPLNFLKLKNFCCMILITV